MGSWKQERCGRGGGGGGSAGMGPSERRIAVSGARGKRTCDHMIFSNLATLRYSTGGPPPPVPPGPAATWRAPFSFLGVGGEAHLEPLNTGLPFFFYLISFALVRV